MNFWRHLSSGLYYFGQGGITRMEPKFDWVEGEQKITGTMLYAGLTLVTIVDEPIDEITGLLKL